MRTAIGLSWSSKVKSDLPPYPKMYIKVSSNTGENFMLW